MFDFRKKPATKRSVQHGAAVPEKSSATTGADWALVRRSGRQEDAVMSALAVKWLLTLPASVRVDELCARYPRVANRLALCWSDPALAERVFADLMMDRRGMRKGFPPAVCAELTHLREVNASCRSNRADDAGRAGWDSRSQAPADR